MPVVDVEDLSVRYESLTAVNRLSFTADSGEVLVLLGPNGAGKTSTIEVLEGYRAPTSGRVQVAGLDPQSDHAQLTRRIGVMLQSGGVYAGIRPLEMLRLVAAFYDDPEDPEDLLERVGLTHRRSARWRQLSGGEQQRLSLALALVGRPEVLFLDEPTSGVDVAGRQLIRTVIGELRSAGVCILLTTHELDEAEKAADRVLIIDNGRLAASGTPAELMTAGSPDEIRFRAPAGIDVAALGKAVMAAVEETAPGDYRVASAPSPANVAAVTAWLAERDLPLGDLRAGRQRLEDVFLRLTAITGEVPVIRLEDEPPAGPRSGTGPGPGPAGRGQRGPRSPVR